MITAQSAIYLQLYGYYKDGYMYKAGGVAEQGMKYMEAMKFIGIEVDRISEGMRGAK